MKLFTLLIATMLSLCCTAQLNLGIAGNNNGVELSAGILAQQIDLQLDFNMPIISTEKSQITKLTVGYQVFLSDKEENYNYSVTPSIGIAGIRKNIFNANKTEITGVNRSIKPIYKLEIGKDSYMGRFVASINYSDALYYGVGIRIFFR